jgi:hypothetical protein
MPMVWLLARRLFGPRAGRWALAFFALSPFAISFATTVYMDPLLTWWIVLAVLAASWRLGLLAGLALGMGFATKQNALLFIPLILFALPLGRLPQVIWVRYSVVSQQFRGARRRIVLILYWVLPLLMAALGFWYIWFKVWQWDGWRILPAAIPDFWTQSWHSYGGLFWVPPAHWPTRIAAWWPVWRWWGGSAVGTLIIALCIIVALGKSVQLLRTLARQNVAWRQQASSVSGLYGMRNQAYWVLLFFLFIVGYIGLHVLLSFQPWDRYLLPLAPLSAILAGQGGLHLWEKSSEWRSIWRWSVAGLVALALALGAGRAAAAKIPVGGDHGAYRGLMQVAQYLRENTPAYHGVIYQRWLGWQWDWYLWDGPPREYWADPDMLLADLASDRYGYTRFVVFPVWRLHEKPALDAALAGMGLHLEERLRVRDATTGETQFVVYEIEPHIRWGE